MSDSLLNDLLSGIGSSALEEMGKVVNNTPIPIRLELAVMGLLQILVPGDELSSDPNFTDTPRRVAKAYLDTWVSGYGDPPDRS